MLRLILVISFILLNYFAFPQKDILTVGLQFKPILPFQSIGSNTQSFALEDVNFELAKHNGYAGGMIIRRGFTDLFAIESGINYAVRNYRFSLQDNNSIADFYNAEAVYRIIGYEIPVVALVYIQLSREIFMNASMGLNMSFFPSDVGIRDNDNTWVAITSRYSFVRPGLSANIGFEYRTDKRGIFYLGGSWQSFFSDPFRASIRYNRPNFPNALIGGVDLNGTYLTFDLRYFFHEEPIKPKKKTKKDPNRVDRLWYLEKNQDNNKKKSK